MGDKEKECFNEFEYKEVELENITTMLWYIIEDYYTLQKNDVYTKANNYDRLGVFLNNIHTLLLDRQTEMKEFIDKVYKERKGEK